jgi:cytochrome P450
MTSRSHKPSGSEPWLAIDPASRRVRLDPGEARFCQDPYSAYEIIRRAAPAFYWEDQKMWCFLNAADVGAILRDRRFGREIPGQPVPAAESPGPLAAFHRVNRDSMLEREPPVHTRLRTLVNHAFLNRAIERLRPRIAALAHESIDRFAPAGRTELLAAFATPIPVIVIAELLGVPAEMAPQLLDWSHRMVAVFQLARTAEAERSAEAATVEFVAYLRGHVERRRSEPAPDLITSLIAAEENGERLSEDEMIATCILLLNAGHEATVHALGNAVKALLEHGEDPRRFLADPASAEATVEECLRFAPPLHLFTRVLGADAEIAGVSLRRGDAVGLVYGAANRDPARYPHAARFDPARSRPPAHSAFGGGIHFCLGAPLARLELQTALPILFERLRGLRLESAPRHRNSYPFHGLEALEVAWA